MSEPVPTHLNEEKQELCCVECALRQAVTGHTCASTSGVKIEAGSKLEEKKGLEELEEPVEGEAE